MAAKGNQNGDVSNGESNGTIVTDARTRMARLVALMAREATATLEETEFLGDDILGIWEAETEEAMWDADNRPPLNFDKLAGTELEIIQVDIKYSNRSNLRTPFKTTNEKGERVSMYLWVTACRTRETGDEDKSVRLPDIGEVFQFNTSARFAVAKLMWLYVHGMIDPDRGTTKQVRVIATEVGDEPGQRVIKLGQVKPATVRA